MQACSAGRSAHRMLGVPSSSSSSRRRKSSCSSRACTPLGLHPTPIQAAASPPGVIPRLEPATANGSGSGPRPPLGSSSWHGGGDGSSSSGPTGGSSHHSALLLGGAGLLSWLADCSPAAAGSRNSVATTWDTTPAKNFELDRLLEQYWDLYGPLVRTLGASGLAGMATAATLKWLGRTVLASLGLLFISLQVLNYYKVITIHWDVFDRSTSWFQQQMDHGIFSKHAVNYWIERGVDMVTEGVPSTAGFTTGFLLGLKMF